MKKFSKIIALAMAAVMTFSISPALTAKAATKDLGSEVVYMRSKKNASTYFTIDGISSVKSLKSDKTSVLKPYNYDIHKSESSYYYDYEGKGNWKKSSGGYKNNYVSISSNAYKPGKATITLVSGSNTYKKTFDVKKYENPLKSLKISNVSSGKNIAGKLKSQNNASVKGKKAASVKVKAQAASGWVITQISMSNTYYDNYSFGPSSNRSFGNGTSKGENTLNYYNYKKSGSVNIYCRNKSTNGTLSVSVDINRPKY